MPIERSGIAKSVRYDSYGEMPAAVLGSGMACMQMTLVDNVELERREGILEQLFDT